MIYLGTDHAGFQLIEQVKTYLTHHNIEFEDMGDTQLDPNDDYPNYAFIVATAVGQGRGTGILACESAGGMTIAANKVKGVRAVECATPQEAKHARNDNDANILVLSHMALGDTDISPILDAWLSTNFSDEERHIRRIQKITDYEEEHYKH